MSVGGRKRFKDGTDFPDGSVSLSVGFVGIVELVEFGSEGNTIWVSESSDDLGDCVSHVCKRCGVIIPLKKLQTKELRR